MKICIVLFALLGCSMALMRIPLKKIQSQREKMIKEGTYAGYRQWKDRHVTMKKFLGLKKVGQNGNIPEKDYGDTTYIAAVTIGGQQFSVIPDTGSSNLWVPDKTCKGDGVASKQMTAADNPCTGKNHYDPSKSSTYQADGRTFSIEYGTGDCSGTLAKDTVTFGGVTATGVTFGRANELADFFAGQPFDGILGLGFQSIAEDNVVPVINQMISEKLLDQQVFGVYFGHTSQDGDVAGELTIGGIDTNHYTGSLTWIPITQKGYWQFKMGAVTVNGKRVGSTSYSAISDTGTSLIVGPSAVISGIAKKLGGKMDNDAGLYAVSCSANLPPVVFTIGTTKFSVPSSDYVIQQDGKCYLGFDSMDDSDIDWILGDCFIRAFYSVYDIGNSRLGLAQSK
jgi:hypothetical protein